MPLFADIAIDVPLNTLFTYHVPSEIAPGLKRGARVLVPFRKSKLVGFCLAVKNVYDEKTGSIPEARLKEILAVDERELLTENYLKWVEFAAEYYACSAGQVLGQAVPPHYLDANDFTVAKKRRARADVIKDLPVSSGLTLTNQQREIYETIATNHDKFYPALIRGVTGSGKTEVYIELIKRVLEEGRSALYLVPEIGLTPQTLARLNSHFAGKLLITHSGLTTNQRLLTWQNALKNTPQVLVGTRSALFAPFRNLGLIIVDEEHDSSYKQEERFRYNARDLAVVRASLEKISIVLGSATPSLETFYQAEQGRYHHFELSERIGSTPLPKIEIIDITREKQQTGLPLNLSQNLTSAMAEHLARSEQIILFVGQRGYAQNAFCLKCHTIQTCLNCSVGLKYHLVTRSLKCHYCALEKHFDEICSACNTKALTLLGMGIQSVEEELHVHFPTANIVRVDSDTFPSPQKLDKVLEDFAARKIDIIVGTQMMSKGHDFANVGFVGIVGIDAHLGLPDFRAAERAFQTVVQVAGRAGRKEKQGRVMVQSYFPAHKSLEFGRLHDFTSFARHELAVRETLCYPPFYRLVQFRFVSNHEPELKSYITNQSGLWERLKERLSKRGVLLLGPAEMPLYKLRGKYRAHLILKIPRRMKNRDVVSYFMNELGECGPKVQMQIDVDPVTLL